MSIELKIFLIIYTLFLFFSGLLFDTELTYSLHHKTEYLLSDKKGIKLLILRLQRKDWLNYDFERDIT